MSKQRNGRWLCDEFMTDLKEEGQRLNPLLKAVTEDSTLCLEIRVPQTVTVYYRGGVVLRLKRKKETGGYETSTTKTYRDYVPGFPWRRLPQLVKTSRDATLWAEAVPTIKLGINRRIDRPSRRDARARAGYAEREARQAIMRDNNIGSIARATDFYFCDSEHGLGDRKSIDLVGVRWPSTPENRKVTDGWQLVFAEVKYGDCSLDDPSGLRAHIADVDAFLSRRHEVSELKEEMLGLFRQKRELSLIDCEKELTGFGDKKPPLLLMILVNHDPWKSGLGKILRKGLTCKQAEIGFAAAWFMGFGLFDDGILTQDQVLSRLRRSL